MPSLDVIPHQYWPPLQEPQQASLNISHQNGPSSHSSTTIQPRPYAPRALDIEDEWTMRMTKRKESK